MEVVNITNSTVILIRGHFFFYVHEWEIPGAYGEKGGGKWKMAEKRISTKWGSEVKINQVLP
jgi:hypothetical protein